MDSYIMAKLWQPDIELYFRCGSVYQEAEMKRLPRHVIIDDMFTLGKWEIPSNLIIPLRNAYFLLGAANYGDHILLGATAGDRVLDKSVEFAAKMQDLLNYLWQPDHWTIGREFNVDVTFKQFTKTELVEMFIEADGDLDALNNETYSCYSGFDEACGECKPCFRKWVALKKFGLDIHPKTKDYIVRTIVPQIEAGTYNRAEEEREIMEAINV